MKKLLHFLFSRTFFIGLFILIQLLLLVAVILRFTEQFVYFYEFCMVLSFLVLLHIINSNTNPAFKIAYIIPVMILPVFGGLFYVFFGKNRMTRHDLKTMKDVGERYSVAMKNEEEAFTLLQQEAPEAAVHARYIHDYANAPAYRHTETKFLPIGETMFEAMLTELRKAEKFIFMEYFIIQEGVMFDQILAILKEKVANGVDVRIIYDGIGCLFTLPDGYDKKLENAGIKCCIFNRLRPSLSIIMNNRDHRKICVIDGIVAFTGGINLADEYINAFEKHGHWLDCGVMLKGDAVYSFTTMFLALWDSIRHEETDFFAYRATLSQLTEIHDDGYVVPYTDTPLDHEAVGETVYLNLITRAKRYVYISTPYLIVDNEMITALCTAAKNGIDVRITTPHVPDKKFVYAMTRSYYAVLIEAGVKIYEYTPGFIHSKVFVSDDEYAVVGSINMDFRSLYLHFECAAWMYRCSAVKTIQEDYLSTLTKSQEISLAYCNSLPWYRQLVNSILRIFAPLM